MKRLYTQGIVSDKLNELLVLFLQKYESEFPPEPRHLQRSGGPCDPVSLLVGGLQLEELVGSVIDGPWIDPEVVDTREQRRQEDQNGRVGPTSVNLEHFYCRAEVAEEVDEVACFELLEIPTADAERSDVGEERKDFQERFVALWINHLFCMKVELLYIGERSREIISQRGGIDRLGGAGSVARKCEAELSEFQLWFGHLGEGFEDCGAVERVIVYQWDKLLSERVYGHGKQKARLKGTRV